MPWRTRPTRSARRIPDETGRRKYTIGQLQLHLRAVRVRAGSQSQKECAVRKSIDKREGWN
jgi:hypothetical protein